MSTITVLVSVEWTTRHGVERWTMLPVVMTDDLPGPELAAFVERHFHAGDRALEASTDDGSLAGIGTVDGRRTWWSESTS